MEDEEDVWRRQSMHEVPLQDLQTLLDKLLDLLDIELVTNVWETDRKFRKKKS